VEAGGDEESGGADPSWSTPHRDPVPPHSRNEAQRGHRHEVTLRIELEPAIISSYKIIIKIVENSVILDMKK
jgi:hypothetical protein